jgi:hypothetical protein
MCGRGDEGLVPYGKSLEHRVEDFFLHARKALWDKGGNRKQETENGKPEMENGPDRFPVFRFPFPVFCFSFFFSGLLETFRVRD